MARSWGGVLVAAATLALAGCIESVESEAGAVDADAAVALLAPDAAWAMPDAARASDAAPASDAGAPDDIDAAGSGGDGQAARPCLVVAPERLDFAATRIGSTSGRTIRLEGCGGRGVVVDEVRVEGDPLGVFAVGAATPIQVLPGGAAELDVRFTPVATEPFAARLVLRHDACDDPAGCLAEVALAGRGSGARPPEPRVEQGEMDVAPLDVVTLDGSASVPGELGITAWHWTVVARPAGSTSQPAERFTTPRRPQDGRVDDDPATPTAQFFVDLAGEYTIELRVGDAAGMPTDAAFATLLIRARPGEDIHVQLVWNTPGDADQTDPEGTDVDLHFLHPTARGWGVSPLDTYFANWSPDWGRQGDPLDDPSLDIDDVDGAGPENINLDNPEDTSQFDACYRVGAHYFRGENHVGGGTYGPSDATVRIYLGGELAYEKTRTLDATDNFWFAAEVCWTDAERRVIDVDRFYETVPIEMP